MLCFAKRNIPKSGMAIGFANSALKFARDNNPDNFIKKYLLENWRTGGQTDRLTD